MFRVNPADSPRDPSLATMLPFIYHTASGQNPVKWPVKVLLPLYRVIAQQSQAHNEQVTLIHSDNVCA